MKTPPPFLQKARQGTLIRVHVQPRASKERISGTYGERLKVLVQAPPVDNKANKACQKLLARALKVPRSDLVLKSGATSRQKTFLVEDLEIETVSSRLKF